MKGEETSEIRISNIHKFRSFLYVDEENTKKTNEIGRYWLNGIRARGDRNSNYNF